MDLACRLTLDAQANIWA